MIEMRREVAVTAPAGVAFDYLADFTNTEHWDPGTVRTVRIAGDGGPGTRYANTSRFAGRTSELVYQVIAVDPGVSIELRGENHALIAHDRIAVRPRAGGGSLVSYRIRFAFQGWRRWAEPLLRPVVARLLDDGARGLRRELSRR